MWFTSHVLHLVLDDTKQWATRRLLYCTTNLGRPPDFGLMNSSATWHLTWWGWVHHSWGFGQEDVLRDVGLEMPERGSKSSILPVVWANLEFFRRDPNDFLSRLLTMDETCLYHYDPETKQTSMEWRHSGPKIPSAKMCWKVLVSNFWNQDNIDYLPKGQTNNAEYYQSLLVHLKDILKKKRSGKVTKVSCSCTTISPHTRHLQHTRIWSTCPSNVLITHPTCILQIYTIGLPPAPWTEINNWKVAVFRPTRRSFLPWRPGWMDNVVNFLSVFKI